MAKKSHIKVRLVPEASPDSSFFYYTKKPTKGEKVKYLLKAQGMTIIGVKKLLNNNKPIKLDELSNKHINISNSNIKNKLIKILKLVKDIKKLK